MTTSGRGADDGRIWLCVVPDKRPNLELLLQSSAVFILRGYAHGPSCVVFKKEIEDEGMLWNAGNTSHCERGSLGDKNV